MTEIEVTGDAVVEVDVGDEVVIRLPENATTGYVWSVPAVGDGLEVVEDTMVPPDVAVPGAGGERVVRLRATGPTCADVVLRLGREWEAEPIEQRHVTVTVAG